MPTSLASPATQLDVGGASASSFSSRPTSSAPPPLAIRAPVLPATVAAPSGALPGAGGDAHHGRRMPDRSLADPDDVRAPRAEAPQPASCVRQLLASRLPLERQKLATRNEKRQRPLGQAAQRGHRPCRYDVSHEGARGVLGPTATDRDPVQSERVDTLAEEVGRSQPGLDERHRHIRAADGQGKAREAGPRTDIDDSRSGGDQLAHHGAVQQMAIPEAVELPRTDQPSFGSMPRQHSCVAPGGAEVFPEHGARFAGRIRRGHSTLIHRTPKPLPMTWSHGASVAPPSSARKGRSQAARFGRSEALEPFVRCPCPYEPPAGWIRGYSASAAGGSTAT